MCPGNSINTKIRHDSLIKSIGFEQEGCEKAQIMRERLMDNYKSERVRKVKNVDFKGERYEKCMGFEGEGYQKV